MDDPDPVLLERFVEGDAVAFEQLFRRLQGEVHHWILRIVRDPAAAEDVLVEAFWRAYRARARFDSRQSFGGWMRRIASNAALDHLRGERRHAASSTARGEIAAPPNTNSDLREAIAVAFHRLPPKLRMVAALALIEEQPLAEIAEALGVPVGTVKSRLSRAGARLREELARLGVRP